jgi:hypothetical protein
MQYSAGLYQDSIRGGHEAYATHDGFIKEYANGSGGSKSTATITTTLDATAAPGDRITFLVTPTGGIPFTVPYVVPSPKPATTADLQVSLLAEFRRNIRVMGLGTWSATATAITFSSLDVGQMVRISATFDPVKTPVAIAQTLGTRAGQRIPAGRLIVTDPSVAHPTINVANGESRLEIAFLPTQNLNLVGSTQRFAGVTLGNAEENAYAIGGFPDGTMAADMAIAPNMRAKQSGYVAIEMETPFNEGAGAIPPLLYRFQADAGAGFNELGTFSLTAGTGLIAVPVKTNIVRVKNGGSTLIVDFNKA